MRAAFVLTATGFVLMMAFILYGFAAGSGWSEVDKLWALPWGKVSFADVYTGFFLFIGWLMYREKNLAVSVIWILLILALGNAITCLYAAIALFNSKGDWNQFWLGKNNTSSAIGK